MPIFLTLMLTNAEKLRQPMESIRCQLSFLCKIKPVWHCSRVQGADKAGLEMKIKQFYAESSADEDSGVKRMVKTNKIATNKTEKASSH
jgi:hypothetical protein